MTARSPNAFFLSALLHGVFAVAVLFPAYAVKDDAVQSKVFELVAGEGDNYGATEAAALGTPGGVKIDFPAPPAPAPAPAPVSPPDPEPPAPAAAPSPVAPAPMETVPV